MATYPLGEVLVQIALKVGRWTREMIGRQATTGIRNIQMGFSLLEVLIALLIAAVGLLSLSSLQISAIKGNSSGNELTQATQLALGTLEQIRAGQYVDSNVFGFIDTSTTRAGTLLDSGMVNGIDAHGAAGGPFNLQWQLAVHSAWSRSMTVTVSWRSILGHARNVDMTSISRGDSRQ